MDRSGNDITISRCQVDGPMCSPDTSNKIVDFGDTVKLDKNVAHVPQNTIKLVAHPANIYAGWFKQGKAKFIGAWTKAEGLRYLTSDERIGTKDSCEGLEENKLIWKRSANGSLPFCEDQKFIPFQVGRGCQDNTALYFGKVEISLRTHVGVVKHNGKKFRCYILTNGNANVGPYDDFEVLCYSLSE